MEEGRAVITDMVAMLSAGERELGEAISRLDQHLQEIDKHTRAAIAEIEATGDRLESAVKAWRRRLKELALSTCADVKAMVRDGMTLLLQRRGRLITHKHVMDRVQGFSTHGSFSDMAAVMKTRVHDLDFRARLPAHAKIFSTVTLIIDPQKISHIEEELSHLGQLQVIAVDGRIKVRLMSQIYCRKRVADGNILMSIAIVSKNTNG